MPKSQVPPPPPPPRRIYKQNSLSPDAGREIAWLRRKGSNPMALRRAKSVSNDDLEELKGCIELGFGFEPDSPELEPKLSDTLPALEFYCAVNRLSRTSSMSSIASDIDLGSTSGSIFDQGDDPETVKLRLKQWAQAVACSVRQYSGEYNSN